MVAGPVILCHISLPASRQPGQRGGDGVMGLMWQLPIHQAVKWRGRVPRADHHHTSTLRTAPPYGHDCAPFPTDPNGLD